MKPRAVSNIGRARAGTSQESLSAALSQSPASAMKFAKMQALGNDFVLVDEEHLSAACRAAGIDSWHKHAGDLALALCDRHFGVGADGFIVAGKERDGCDLSWTYLNSDGSNALMCGNGLRCLALWAVIRKFVVRPDFQIATGCGAVPVYFADQDHITIDIGEPILESTGIPCGGPARSRVVRERLAVMGREFIVTCVSMGNPHCVIIGPQADAAEYAHLGPAIQSLPFFPQGVNVEFVRVENRNKADAFVWERGCGATLACASGAAAVVVAGVLEEVLDRSACVELPGGALAVEWSAYDNHVRLTGPAREVYTGLVDLQGLLSEAAGAS